MMNSKLLNRVALSLFVILISVGMAQAGDTAPNLGQCVSDRIKDNCSGLTGGAKKDCAHEQIGWCHELFEIGSNHVDDFQSMSCEDIKPITALILIWDGEDGINVTTELGQEINGIDNGDVIYVEIETDEAGNDFSITISGAVEGESEFHLSCSDEDMDGPEDCGTLQGNGKPNDISLINQWLFAGMEGEDGEFECYPIP